MNEHGLRFLKGHGTENDFILLPDYEGSLDLTASLVQALCDRRAGIGADGVLRVVRTDRVEGLADRDSLADEAAWFMDYRNADGSVAEMCGNGVRVIGLYLVQAGLVLAGRASSGSPQGSFPVATRAGVRNITLNADWRFTVNMGRASWPGGRVGVVTSEGEWEGVPVSMGNPHVVTFVSALSEPGGLHEAPLLSPKQAQGANVEFVVRRGPSHVAMRVFERGVGETRSCGTGACAAAAAAVASAGGSDADSEWQNEVDVPGGRLTVNQTADGELLLTGPAVLLADGEVSPDWVAEHA